MTSAIPFWGRLFLPQALFTGDALEVLTICFLREENVPIPAGLLPDGTPHGPGWATPANVRMDTRMGSESVMRLAKVTWTQVLIHNGAATAQHHHTTRGPDRHYTTHAGPVLTPREAHSLGLLDGGYRHVPSAHDVVAALAAGRTVVSVLSNPA